MQEYTTADALSDWNMNMAKHLDKVSRMSPGEADDYLTPGMREETRQECF